MPRCKIVCRQQPALTWNRGRTSGEVHTTSGACCILRKSMVAGSVVAHIDDLHVINEGEVSVRVATRMGGGWRKYARLLGTQQRGPRTTGECTWQRQAAGKHAHTPARDGVVVLHSVEAIIPPSIVPIGNYATGPNTAFKLTAGGRSGAAFSRHQERCARRVPS